MSSLIYADGVVLLWWASDGLLHLSNSMRAICSYLGITSSSSKTEVVVFNGHGHGSSADNWCLGEHALPMSTSFKYLGLIFPESGSLSLALARLACNGKGATALLPYKFKKWMCDQSFPMMRRLSHAIVLPKVCEVWAPACSRAWGLKSRRCKTFRSVLSVSSVN